MHIPPDWGIFTALIVSFLIFWFIFGRLFFSPFLKLLAQREGRLKELNERTTVLLEQEKAVIEKRREQLAAVRREALEHRDAERRRAEAEASKMIEEARAESHAQLEQVRSEIEQRFSAAGRQLEQLAQTLAAELAGRVLGRPVTENGQRPRNS